MGGWIKLVALARRAQRPASRPGEARAGLPSLRAKRSNPPRCEARTGLLRRLRFLAQTLRVCRRQRRLLRANAQPNKKPGLSTGLLNFEPAKLLTPLRPRLRYRRHR